MLAELLDCCIETVPNKRIEEYPHMEKLVKDMIRAALEICENGCKPLKCYNGTSVIKTDDNKCMKKKLYKEYIPEHKEDTRKYMEKFKNRYNKMPDTLRMLEYYNEEIRIHEENVKAYVDAEKQYFEDNPSLKEKYESNNGKICIIATCILGAFSLLNDFQYEIIQAVFVCLTLYFGYKSYEQYKYEEWEKELIVHSFPEYLKNLKKKYEESIDLLPRLQQEKREYIRLHTI